MSANSAFHIAVLPGDGGSGARECAGAAGRLHAGDDEMVAEVMRRFGLDTKKSAVELALRRLLDATEAALAEDGHELLSPAERQHIRDAMNLVAERLETEADTESVKAACNALNMVTNHFAARRMDASIRKALAGRVLESIT